MFKKVRNFKYNVGEGWVREKALGFIYEERAMKKHTRWIA